MSAKRTGPEKAVDELRKRIASEAEIIVHETMPRKVRHAPPRRCDQGPHAGARAGGACLRRNVKEAQWERLPLERAPERQGVPALWARCCGGFLRVRSWEIEPLLFIQSVAYF